jgi:hypothetical protein
MGHPNLERDLLSQHDRAGHPPPPQENYRLTTPSPLSKATGYAGHLRLENNFQWLEEKKKTVSLLRCNPTENNCGPGIPLVYGVAGWVSCT